jgi:hypothetical protein
LAVEARLDAATEYLVEFALGVRRERERQFGDALSADPGWDILLQLYAAKLRGESLRLDQLMGPFPLSVLARWARLLDEHGLLEWSDDYLIGSAHSLRLTPVGAMKMSRVFRNPASRWVPALR